MRSYVIEAQDIFLPALSETLVAAGLDIVKVASQPDMHSLLQTKPEAVFIDLDFVDRDPLETINVVRTLLPEALLCIYTNASRAKWAQSCLSAGANAVISKASTREAIILGLRRAAATGTFVDDHL